MQHLISACLKTLISAGCLVLLCLPANSATSSEVIPLDREYLKNFAQTRGFTLGRPVKAKPTPDGKAVIFLRSQARLALHSLYIMDLATAKTSELCTVEQLLKGSSEHLSDEEKARRERQRISVGGFTDFQISDDGTKVLLSLSGKLYILNRSDSKVSQLQIGENAIDPKFSPDGKMVAYVQEHDLHVVDLASGKARAVTTGGTALKTHGLAEFVAQEELARFSGYWWSPDSSSIVYEEADAHGVEVWHLADPEHPEKAPIANFYPRPGKANVRTRLGIIPASGGQTVWIDWNSSEFPYLAAVDWSKQAPLSLVVSARDQKELHLLSVEPKSGKTSLLLSEHDDAWINQHRHLPAWLEDGASFLWISESNGGPQLALHDKSGKLDRILVGPDNGSVEFIDVDSANGVVYYRASKDPTESQIFKVPLAGGQAVALSKGRGTHLANFSHDHSIYVEDASLLDSMPLSSVYRSDGTLIAALPAVAEEVALDPNVQFVELDGPQKFHAYIVRPQNFEKTLSYPVIVDVYGGPGVNKVLATKRAFLLDQWLADQGFIVVSIDGRGTPGRGRDWERAICHHFGSVPLDDQVQGLSELVKKFPEMDASRVGITGWSFGGYMSALAVLRRPDVFKAAVAGAPVVDWYDYDSCYTERYLGLPDKFPDGYKEGSLLTYASKLDRPLLLVHGTTDDNVFFRHSLKLADALFRSGRDFEILPLSGLTHMVPDPVVMEQLWSKIARHFQKHLGKPQALTNTDTIH